MPEDAAATERLAALDLIRGIAVLGILTINIAGFAGPIALLNAPNLFHPVGFADEAAFLFGFVFFEGKMRALFTLLFGAGLILFWERAERAGRDADVLQLRRLSWLMLFGMLHYLLLWWGDILFVYAVCGLGALLLRPLSDRILLIVAFFLFFSRHLWGMLGFADAIAIEAAVRSGTAETGGIAAVETWLEVMRNWAGQETRESQLGFLERAAVKLAEQPFWLVEMVSRNFAETLPLMLIGMVMFRKGFFDGRMPRGSLAAIAAVCIATGLALSAAFAAWAWQRGFPPLTMQAALVSGMSLPRLLCGVGYAALLILAAPVLRSGRAGRLISGAGQMAFSNYILTSALMTFVFQGWGLGLFGAIGPARQWLFVVAGWLSMLSFSALWLRHFRRGPLEWAWRSLVEGRTLPNRA